MMKEIFIFIVAAILFCCSLAAQEQTLEAVDAGVSGFGEVRITKVRVLSETEETLHLEVAYDISNDKKQAIQGQILNPRRTKIKEISSTSVELSNRTGVVDLRFDLKQIRDKSKFTEPYLDSHFVKIMISEASEDSWGDILSVLGDDNPLEDVFADGFLFRYEKKWRIGGGMLLDVPIQPIGRAITIKP